MSKLIFIILGILLIVGFIFFRFKEGLINTLFPSSEVVEVKVWGVWDDESIFRVLADEYAKNNPNVKISYTRQNFLNYRPRLQTQISQGSGPDVYAMHSNWLPMLISSGSITKIPANIMNINEFSSLFYPVAKDSLTIGSDIYSLPLEIDGLALYVNEDILRAANLSLPKTWDEFIKAAVGTTVKDTQGNIKTAGAALGTANNVDHFSDILGLLFYQQPKASLVSPATKEGEEVLRFYTSFVLDPKIKVWDSTMESSTQAFINNKLLFYFAPYWRSIEIKKTNPNLNFKVIPVPQLPDSNASWGNFWSFGVSSQSKYKNESFKFLKFLIEKDTQKLFYKTSKENNVLAHLYSRVDLAQQLKEDKIAGAFIQQAPNFKSWYLSSFSLDQGLNDEIIKLYSDAVTSVLQGANPLSTLQNTSAGIKEVLNKYQAF